MAAEARFTVNPDALREAARSLVVVAAHLDNARESVRTTSTEGFGSARLSRATRDFVDHWEWQATRLSTSLCETSDRLHQAIEGYESVEAAQLHAQGQQ